MFRLRAPVLLLSVMLAGACGLQAASAFRFHHPRLKSVDIVPSEVVGGSATVVTGTVTLDEPAPTGGDVVTLSSSDTSSATVPASVTIAAGATSATFAVTTAQVSWESTVRIKAVLGANDHVSLADSMALRLACHNEAIHRRHAPQNQNAIADFRKFFDLA